MKNNQNLSIRALVKNAKKMTVHRNLLKRSYDRTRLPEDEPRFKNRADQTFKKAPNPDKCRFKIVEARAPVGGTETVESTEDRPSAVESALQVEESESETSEDQAPVATAPKRRGRPKGSRQKAQDEVSAEINEELNQLQVRVDETGTAPTTAVPKKRGRPKGSNNRAQNTRAEKVSKPVSYANLRRSERIKDKALRD